MDAKISRKTQQIFAGNAAVTGNIAQFGSLQASAPAYSNDPTVIQSLPAWGIGWPAAVINNAAPCIQDMTAVQYVYSYQLGYLLQQGIAEYDSATTYFVGSLVSDGVGSVYISKTNVNIGNALTSATNWQLYYSNAITTVTTTYAVINSDSYIRATGSTDFNITIPAASSDNVGRKITIKSALTNSALMLVLVTTGLIDNLESFQLYPFQSITIVSNGTNWDIINSYIYY